MKIDLFEVTMQCALLEIPGLSVLQVKCSMIAYIYLFMISFRKSKHSNLCPHFLSYVASWYSLVQDFLR